MKVIKTENAGFCFGVRRSLDLLDEAIIHAETLSQKAVMLGSIIHNPRLIAQYGEQGVEVASIDSLSETGVVIVRSHGITKQDDMVLSAQNGLEVVDTTCPFVRRIYDLVAPFQGSDEGIVVLGSSDHAEVKAIVSRISVSYLVVAPEELENIHQVILKFMTGKKRVLLVAQTTSQPANYLKLLGIIESFVSKTGVEVIQENTVCHATNHRQGSARAVAEQVDAMVVIGGFNSSNTHKLFLVVKEILTKVWHIESADDFTESDIAVLRKCATVGITAGASTPDDQIEELQLFLEQL